MSSAAQALPQLASELGLSLLPAPGCQMSWLLESEVFGTLGGMSFVAAPMRLGPRDRWLGRSDTRLDALETRLCSLEQRVARIEGMIERSSPFAAGKRVPLGGK